jgi:hypothetical protein
MGGRIDCRRRQVAHGPDNRSPPDGISSRSRCHPQVKSPPRSFAAPDIPPARVAEPKINAQHPTAIVFSIERRVYGGKQKDKAVRARNPPLSACRAKRSLLLCFLHERPSLSPTRPGQPAAAVATHPGQDLREGVSTMLPNRNDLRSPGRKAQWKHWGPFLSERQWGTVREDYSEGGDAWNFFTHDTPAPGIPLGRGRHRGPSATTSSGCASPWPCGTGGPI